MATLHHHVHDTAHLPRTSNRTRTVLTAGLLAGAAFATPTAQAAPADRAATSAAAAATAEVAAVQARVTAAEDQLQRMTIEAEAASGTALAAEAALAEAEAQATATAWELASVRGEVDQSQEDVAQLGREAYMGADDTFGDVGVLLDAGSPNEVLQQAATLEVLGEERTEQLEDLEDAEARKEEVDRAARASVADRERTARAAADARAAAEAQLSAAQGTYDALAAEKAALDAQLREAEIRLLGLRGAADPAAQWAGQEAARQLASPRVAAVPGGAVAPTSGRVTSCYGSRWGTLHAGVDIAAPIGTPVYTPESGIVLEAGPASGFGLAVYVQHEDGTVTLYGHVNQFFVTPGQVVGAGQQIAEVGNRGQSTGPHLHFEVHDGGLYADRVNPTPWLTARGISLGAC